MCLAIMEPVRQLICEGDWRKSTNYFGLKCANTFREYSRSLTVVCASYNQSLQSSAFLTPGSGSEIRDMFFADYGSPTHISERLVTNVWVKNTLILCQFAQIFSAPVQK
jgi:hypothetical protein